MVWKPHRAGLPCLTLGIQPSATPRTPHTVDFNFILNHFGAPDWADTINYYISRVPFGGRIYRILPDDGETRGPISTTPVKRGPDGSVIELPDLFVGDNDPR